VVTPPPALALTRIFSLLAGKKESRPLASPQFPAPDGSKISRSRQSRIRCLQLFSPAWSPLRHFTNGPEGVVEGLSAMAEEALRGPTTTGFQVTVGT
jgi:hypothetical protein